MRLFEIAYF